jgi:hypothetical protein
MAQNGRVTDAEGGPMQGGVGRANIEVAAKTTRVSLLLFQFGPPNSCPVFLDQNEIED